MRVAIQGIAGSFHHEAAMKLFGKDFELVPCNTFADVFKAVKDGHVDYGVSAVENSLYGSINAVYGLLAREKLWVSDELYLKIDQYLIGAAGTELSYLVEVSSFPAALAQCEQWLDSNLPKAIRRETADTAMSVRDTIVEDRVDKAAIASKQAAKLYDARIIAGPINDDPHNYTRFFLLSKDKRNALKANKTSIILKTSHKPGALHEALGVFADAKVNLSKLDSHPIPGDTWHYAFYVDFEAGLQTNTVQDILKQLKKLGCTVTILGSYVARPIAK